MTRIVGAAISLCILFAVSTMASGQSNSVQYPQQTVRIIVPVSPGSIADGFARMIAEKLAEIWKQQVIVENLPGLSGTASVAKSLPDGYTLLLNSNGHTVAGAINKSLSFDPVKDFAGITLVASVPLVMIIPPDLPAKTMMKFIELAKDKPGQLNFANAGVSTTSFLSAEIFKQNAKINVVHVPYRGAPEAITAVMRGDAHMYFAPIPSAQELGAVGKVVALSINSSERAPQMSQMPTIAEAGLPEFKYESWFGMLAPATTPQPILQKISQDVRKVLSLAELHDRIQTLGAIPVTSTPEQFDIIIKNDTERNGKILRDAGISAN